MLEIAGSEASPTLLQHCNEPVLAEQLPSGVLRRVGVAAARVARARVTSERLNCMLDEIY